MLSIDLPSSKSISNRWLMLRAACGLTMDLDGLSEANDTRLMQTVLDQVATANPSQSNRIYCANAGTVLRFLCPFLCFTPGLWILQGDARLAQRPMRGLVESLQDMGAQLGIDSETDSLPIYISGTAVNARSCILENPESAQYVSGLMMSAPLIGLPFTIHVEQMHQYPYVKMTAHMMELLGFEIMLNDRFIHIQGQLRPPSSVRVEADWSAASYVYAAQALKGHGEVFLPRLTEHSWQGDAIVAKWMRDFGVESTFVEQGVILRNIPIRTKLFEADFRLYPDLAPTFAILSALMGYQAELSGLSALKDKECDRLNALCQAFEALNIRYLHLDDDSLLLWPSDLNPKPDVFKVYHDHRMVMALWLCKFRIDTVAWDDPDCVDKSFPNFHQTLSPLLN